MSRIWNVLNIHFLCLYVLHRSEIWVDDVLYLRRGVFDFGLHGQLESLAESGGGFNDLLLDLSL